ncbi:MAG: glycosyltransferase family 4 protein [Chloroflexaceae bacterium]|nr:glycosyltransferase family 4 protein [Chloroflexaceae bacterium]
MRTLQLARQLQPDHVCCFSREAGLVLPILRAQGRPAFFYLASPELTPLPRSPGMLLQRGLHQSTILDILTARNATRILSISASATEQARTYWHVAADRVVTLGTGIDNVFCTVPLQMHTLAQPFVPSFISVGRINLRQKPLEQAAAALSSLSVPWQAWVIVGAGSFYSGGKEEDQLKEWIQRLRLQERTVFTGQLPAQEVVAQFQQHPIALLPSRYESFFLTVYEAVACGCVVVTNDVANIRSYFHDVPSVIIAHDSSWEAYRAAILQAIAIYPEVLPTLPTIAQRVRAECGWSSVADRFEQALQCA